MKGHRIRCNIKRGLLQYPINFYYNSDLVSIKKRVIILDHKMIYKNVWGGTQWFCFDFQHWTNESPFRSLSIFPNNVFVSPLQFLPFSTGLAKCIHLTHQWNILHSWPFVIFVVLVISHHIYADCCSFCLLLCFLLYLAA